MKSTLLVVDRPPEPQDGNLAVWGNSRRLPQQGLATNIFAVVEQFSEHAGIGTVRVGELLFPFHCAVISDGSRTVADGSDVVVMLGVSRAGGYQAVLVTKV
ncbi:MAG: hypothetical protein HKL82_06830 [Acidimicrobiaceae bacterium]|nr:hypothetical protein [Acidimicrobiaceae bacterium]